MTRGGFAILIAATAAAAATLAFGELRAAPLDAQSCTKLKDERAGLEQAGVRTTIAKGPEWAKGNLPADKLEQVRRLIELDGQLTFRCQGKPLVSLPPEIEADPAAVDPDAKHKATAPGKAAKGAPADRKAPVKKAAAPPADPAAAQKTPPAPKAVAPKPAKDAKDASGQPAATATAPPKAKPKPKANDAYKPPPADPTGNPFASQIK